jgi:hypothetical protein
MKTAKTFRTDFTGLGQGTGSQAEVEGALAAEVRR